ncbi:MAG: hypothetical protein E7273_02365 [Pseudobutyrivibrio ruminis]|nr:hypothetical protein [Pseudobutyrivibrio ruminis]
MKIQAIVDNLIEWHQPYENPKTRDTIKCGNPDTECTGIAVTCYASYEVIREAIEKKCNLIIAHESLYYGDEYSLDTFEGISAFDKKRKLLEDNNIVVFRNHDRMHGKGKPWVPERVRNDYIYYGLMKELAWEKYVVGDTMKPLLYHIPEIEINKLADFFMDKLDIKGMRVVGSTNGKVSDVFIAEHCNGKGDDEIIKNAVNAQVIVPLEICDYTVASYVRDAALSGETKVIFEMGHFNVEEMGMKYMVKWLPEAIKIEDVPIYYIKSGDTFDYYLRKKV